MKLSEVSEKTGKKVLSKDGFLLFTLLWAIVTVVTYMGNELFTLFPLFMTWMYLNCWEVKRRRDSKKP